MNLKDQVFEVLTKDANDWIIDRYYAYHKPTKVNYWLRAGIFFFNCVGDYSVSIGLVNRIKLFFWLKNARRQQILNEVTGT